MARHDKNLGGCVPAALFTAPSYFFSLTSALAPFLATRASFEKKPAMLSPSWEAAGQPSTQWAAGACQNLQKPLSNYQLAGLSTR
jgi:hypothetical protein